MNISFSDNAAPKAIITSGWFGTITSSSDKFNLSLKTRIRFLLKLSGPPSNTMGGLISSPCASPPMVYFAIAWKVDNAILSFATP